ncbi:MAG: AAA family ATPase [Cyanobacteria bacterium P01_F01_bin.143]
MLSIPDYQIQSQIYKSENSLVYQGTRKRDNKAVILKLLRENYPSPTELTYYKQEYRITHELDILGMIKAEELIEYGNTFIIVFEDFGGKSLKHVLPQQIFNLIEWVQLAIQIVDSLGNIHQAGIIHKDINPSNIVYNSQTQELKIIDFGIATLLNSENPPLKNPQNLEGTLAYISPEQTGRMNRSLDYRSDFYSLGVTFYELFTGQLPFETDDALALLHAHIAKQPLSVISYQSSVISCQDRQQAITEIIDKIIGKLMAKNVEERYQSAWGIKADLAECLRQLQNEGKITSFIIGSQDFISQEHFYIPEKLYGRETEIQTLLNAFNAVRNPETINIASKLILVSGYSGIGKSALVKELYKPITEARGYFISGKFEQYQRDIPYSAIANAFKFLIEQILCESAEKLNQWKEQLLQTLGSNTPLIIKVIPELELIIGQQQKIEGLSGLEVQNRLNLVFKKLIRVFATKENPLVLFIDDLQWADNAT